eukprot:1758173-Rhodomonas_salina.1
MYVMISPAMRERVNALAALKFASRCKDILLSPAKQNVDKDPLQSAPSYATTHKAMQPGSEGAQTVLQIQQELEEAKSAAEKHKQEAAHVHAQLAGQVRITLSLSYAVSGIVLCGVRYCPTHLLCAVPYHWRGVSPTRCAVLRSGTAVPGRAAEARARVSGRERPLRG